MVFLGLLFAYIYVKPKHLHPAAASRTRGGSTVPSAGLGGGRKKPPLALFDLMTLCLVAALFFVYLVLVVGKFLPEGVLHESAPACVAVGILVQARIRITTG